MNTRLTVVISNEHKKIFLSTAKESGMAMSSWVRSTLIAAARGSTQKQETYRWAGKKCTKEEYESGMKKYKAVQDRISSTAPAPEIQSKLDEMDAAEENAD